MLEGIALLGVACAAGAIVAHRADDLSSHEDHDHSVDFAAASGEWGIIAAIEIGLRITYARMSDEERAHSLATASSEEERVRLLGYFPQALTQIGPLDV